MGKKLRRYTPNQMRHFRLDAGLTQGDVAFLLGIKNAGRVSQWESSAVNPDIEHLLSLAIIYNHLPDELYFTLRRELEEKLRARRKLLEQIKVAKRARDRGG